MRFRFLALAAPLAAAIPLQALGQTAPARDDSITVTGSREAPSNWRLAETDHVVVLSDGGQGDLSRIAHNLERLHFLLSVLLNRTDKSDDARKLRVTLIGDGAEFDAMDLRDTRYAPGPYAAAFRGHIYYDPREDGAVAAASRYDQNAVLERGETLASVLPALVRATDTTLQPGESPAAMPGMSLLLSGGGASMRFPRSDDPLSAAVNESSVTMPAEGRIYAGFARHYLLSYFPNAYPRWYVDGFGEIFATIQANADGSLDYGRPPEGYRRVIDRFLRYPLSDVLSGHYLADKNAAERWTPFHAWALAHMLFFSETRRPQLMAYLAAIAAGQPPETAMAAFGDLEALQRELTVYDDHKVPYERITYPAELVAEPLVRTLTQGEAAFLKGRLELGSRVEASADVEARDRWLAGLRKEAARYRANSDAQLLLAEAECRGGNAAECIAAADRALEIAPGNSDALAWKGMGQVRIAIAGPAASRAAALKAARRTIAQANRANTENPVPLIAYYRSFADAGEKAPDVAMEGLLKAVDIVPAAPATRLMLGEAFARDGNPEAARRALRPVADGAYDSPERIKARALLATLPG